MRWIVFCGTLTDESIGDLLEEINNTQEDIALKITSNGGSVPLGEFLTEVINNEEKIKLIYFSWEISSAMFDVFLLNKKPYKTLGMFSTLHLKRRNISTQMDNEDYFLLDRLEESNQKMIELFTNAGLEQDKLDRILNHEDVYITQEEAIEMKETLDRFNSK